MASLASVRALPILVGALDEDRAPELVIGRTDLVARLWAAAREKNVRITGARHMGKTWALKLAASQHPDWASPILVEAGACQSIPELTYRIATAFGRIGIVPRDWAGRVAQWHAKLLNPDADGKPATPWLMVLNGTLQHASSHLGATTPTIILDGFGELVDRLCQSGAHDGARKLVDAVSSFENDWHRLRCIVSGCSELDDALSMLYAGVEAPLPKTFAQFDVPPLAHEDAQYLAACLLLGEGVPCSDLHDVAEAVATASGENPYLIHNTIDWMVRFQPGVWTPDRVQEVPTVLWNEPMDDDDTTEVDEPLQRNSIDEELTKAASMLESLAEPAEEITPSRKPEKHPVLTLPPAFMLLNSVGETAPAPSAAPARDESPSKLMRDWRRVQPYLNAQPFALTQPASFYVTLVESRYAQDEEQEPQSFVSLSNADAPIAGMRALAEARQALLALEEPTPLLGIEADDALFQRGAAQLQRGQFEFALDIFQELARRTRNGAHAEFASASLVNTAYALARLHRYEEAAGVCDALVRQFGEDHRAGVLACVAIALVNKSAALIAIGRGNDAIVVCRALLACSTPDTESVFAEAILSARYNLAYALNQLGNEGESAAAYKTLSTTCREAVSAGLRTMGADAAYNTAVAHHRNARRVETIEACETAVALNPEHLRAHALRVVAYLQLHLVGEAIAAIGDVFRAYPPDSTQRAFVLSEILRESAASPGLLQIVVSASRDDLPALVCGLTLWLRRQLPLDHATAVHLGVAEHALRPQFEGHADALAALDLLRAARLVTLGDPSALATLSDEHQRLLG